MVQEVVVISGGAISDGCGSNSGGDGIGGDDVLLVTRV